MANSRGRRKLRRLLQEAGLGHLLKPLEPAAEGGTDGTDQRKPGLFRRIRLGGWLLLGVLATAITLLEGYPWLSITQDYGLNENNPYQTMFYVTNEGYLPADDLRATCTEAMGDSARNDWNFNTGDEEQFADRLYHSGRATLPCYRHIVMKGPWPRFVRTQLSVKVIYYVWPLTCPFCTRHQTFRMEGASDEHGKMHWAFVG